MSASEQPGKTPPPGDATADERDAVEAEKLATSPPVKQMDNMAATLATKDKKRRPPREGDP